MVDKIKEDYYRLEFSRFKDIQELRKLINTNGDLKVKSISPKKFYDSDFEDWCYYVILENTHKEEVADLTVWYAKARANKIITEISLEYIY